MKTKKTLKNILELTLKRRKIFHYNELVSFAYTNGCKEDTIRRQLEPDRSPDMIKIYNDKNHIVAWRKKK